MEVKNPGSENDFAPWVFYSPQKFLVALFVNLGFVYMHMGDNPKALQYLNRAAELDPRSELGQYAILWASRLENKK